MLAQQKTGSTFGGRAALADRRRQRPWRRDPATIWGTTADARFGHRRTEIETVPDLDHLVHRLNQLAAVMFGVDGLAAAA